MTVMFSEPGLEEAARNIMARTTLAAVKRALLDPEKRKVVYERIERDKEQRKEVEECSM